MSDSYAMRFISYDWKFEHDSKILCSSLKMYVHRLILSDRHHDKPPIRAAVGAITGDERQKVVIAGYGHYRFHTGFADFTKSMKCAKSSAVSKSAFSGAKSS